MSVDTNSCKDISRPDGGITPQRTYALVVGIEHYDAGPAWNLNGPAQDAARFTSWLLDRGVPADQMLVFLSPLDEQLSNVPMPSGVSISPARREHVTEAITRTLPRQHGDLLWLFWSGHGVLTRDDRLRLFYSDASVDDKRNLNLDSLLIALRSDLYGGFPRQIGVADACQTYAERLQLAKTLPDEALPYGKPLPGREQFFLYAASPGQVAVNLETVSAGLFSRMVIEELKRSDDHRWPPPMDLVANRLDQRFNELRAAGHADQTPTSFRWRPWTGGERVLGETMPEPPEAAAAAARRPPSGAALRELVDRLLALDVMADPVSRANVVRRLRKGLATSISYDSAGRPHVVNIVTRSLDYPGGITELMEAIKLYVDPADPALVKAEQAATRLASEVSDRGG